MFSNFPLLFFWHKYRFYIFEWHSLIFCCSKNSKRLFPNDLRNSTRVNRDTFVYSEFNTCERRSVRFLVLYSRTDPRIACLKNRMCQLTCYETRWDSQRKLNCFPTHHRPSMVVPKIENTDVGLTCNALKNGKRRKTLEKKKRFLK